MTKVLICQDETTIKYIKKIYISKTERVLIKLLGNNLNKQSNIHEKENSKRIFNLNLKIIVH